MGQTNTFRQCVCELPGTSETKSESLMGSQAGATAYDAYYYATSCGRPYQRDDVWLRLFDVIADRIVRELRPQSVLDAGCAMGFLVEGLRRRGVEAFGFDISEYAIKNV